MFSTDRVNFALQSYNKFSTSNGIIINKNRTKVILGHLIDNDYAPLIYMMLFSLLCCIFKPIKICISIITLGKQAKHHACEPADHLGG